jgi:hypothetical protein
MKFPFHTLFTVKIYMRNWLSTCLVIYKMKVQNNGKQSHAYEVPSFPRGVGQWRHETPTFRVKITFKVPKSHQIAPPITHALTNI